MFPLLSWQHVAKITAQNPPPQKKKKAKMLKKWVKKREFWLLIHKKGNFEAFLTGFYTANIPSLIVQKKLKLTF